VYQNNFIDNIFHLTATIYQYGGTYAPGYVRTVYNLAAPDGGNYYSDYHTPAQGCDNTNPVDTFCDAPYSFPGGQDNLPWTMQIVTNQQPTVDAGGAYSGDEGSAIAMSAATATDPDGDILTYAWSTDSTLCTFDDASVLNPTLTCNDDGNFTATLTVSDGINEAVANTAGVTVNNVAPVVGDITAPIDPVPVNTAINASASFSDAGTSDTHIAEWNWGDTTCDPEGTVTYQGNGSSVLVSGSCTYTTPGIYTVKLTVTDDDGGSGTSEFKYVVVYDPDGSFVTGGGWINSPAGAYVADLALTGKANFGFMAEYKKGTNVPTGKTQFQFHAADFNFRSSTYEWLVVAGARAQFKGIGEINGSGSYGFLLFAIDGQVTGGGGADKFRIKIWDKNNEDAVVYDNELGGADDAEPTMVIGGGSIVISTVGNN
jgi:PKD repeat protein